MSLVTHSSARQRASKWVEVAGEEGKSEGDLVLTAPGEKTEASGSPGDSAVLSVCTFVKFL